MKQAADWMIQKRRGKCVYVHGTSVLTVTRVLNNALAVTACHIKGHD